MRGLRSTILLVAVLAGLGAYIYFVTWKLPEGGATDAKKLEKVFAGYEADKVEEIKVMSAAGDATTLRKEGGVWKLTQPIAAKADESEVSGITTALGQIEVSRVIDENPTNLNDYGLSNPRIQIDFKAAGDTDYKKLLVGDKSPTGSDIFAKRNDDKQVFLIPSFQETSVNRTTFDLREKSVLKFDREKVDGIDVTSSGKTLTVAKEGGDWKITKPVQTKADFGSVEGLVGRLQSVQMKSIVADNPPAADLKKYGLDKPEATVNLSAGSTRAVESALLDDLKKSADDYRRKDVFEFRPFNANRIEMTRNDQTVVLERVKGQGENAPDTWRRVTPSAKDVERDKSDSLLSKLSNIRAASFVESTAKTGLDKPALTVSVKFDDGKKEEKVTFGQAGSDVYVSRPGEPGAAKIDAADFNDAIKSLDELSK